MKAKHLVASGAVLLCSMTGIAHSQPTQAVAPPTPSSAQQPIVNTAPQTVDQSVGGASMYGTHDSGRGRNGSLCIVGLSCDIYKGN
ncbi:hypothetical protein ACOCG7_06695 [Paraburkholderia sp. DD10]|uniref:hypothetical protein n=1 Tax=Paraburkholderia TaxID=1822464 RepID=UPI000DEECA28|nr:hypothetical protein [Paraburkholderia terricola]AXE96684.1 hypothetical protein CUJ90_31610 [Paraburkholderia terricola]